MKGKPYRSLDEIYLNESFAKPVPALPRHLIFGEAAGQTVSPSAPKRGKTPDPGKHVQYYFDEPGLYPDEAERMPKTKGKPGLPYEVPGEVKKGESDLLQIALQLFKGKGQGIEDAARTMVSKLREISYNDDANEEYKNVRETLIKLTLTKNKITELPPEDSVFSLIDEIKNKTGNANYDPRLIYALLNTTGKLSTNLGKVELGLTIFYADAKKAAKGGDVEMQRSEYNGVPLAINSISYEIKGEGGRMGDGEDGQAMLKLEKYMNEFYRKYNINKEYRRIQPGGRSRILIDNINLSVQEILNAPDSTIKDLCDLILQSSPKPNTPEKVISDFYSFMQTLDKNNFVGERNITTLIATALQMYTYRETDGHHFQKFFAYKQSESAFNALVVDVSNFDFSGYYALLEKHFDVTKPTTDNKYSAFGITLK